MSYVIIDINKKEYFPRSIFLLNSDIDTTGPPRVLAGPPRPESSPRPSILSVWGKP